MDTSGETRPGRLLDGRYRVGAVIARGGMSTVYRGVDTRLDRPVAIKIMHQGYVSDPAFLARFAREARLAAGLRHPGVVGVYDQGRDDETVFLVMELVDGGTLRDLLRQRGALPVPTALSVLEPLLAALGAAHSAGLVHRDVKPENVLISARGEVKVADFGLVRAVSSHTLATGDVILGTVAYLSPEQVATGASDMRSDVYSAGIVAYEMLTGTPPFSGDNPISVAYQHVHSDVPPVTDLAPGVPVELDDLVLAATRRDPDARPRDAGTFLASVGGVRDRLNIPLVRVPTPRAPEHLRPAGTGPLDEPSGAPANGSRGGANGSAGRGPRGTRMVPVAGSADPGGPGGRAERGTGATRTVTTRGRPTQPEAGRSESTVASPTGVLAAVRRPSPSRKLLRRRLIVVLVILLLGTAAALGGWWLGSGRWAYMPKTIGVDRAAAESLIRQAGLVAAVSDAPDNAIPTGAVARATPAAGTRALRGTQVMLVISSGRPRVPVIRAGAAVSSTRAMIGEAHLTAVLDVAADQFDDVVPAGAVLGTDPVAGTPLPLGGRVIVIRSLGAAPVVIPPVAGKTVEDARNALLATGLTVGPMVDVFAPEVPDGTLVGTRPAQGSVAAKGSPVSLLAARSLVVPATQGRSLTEATALLLDAGFTVTTGEPVVDPDADGGSVSGTVPSAGLKVDPAQPAVVLHLSNAVTVPRLTGGSVEGAATTLSTLGLRIEVVAMVGSGGARVISQSPDSGVRVAPGSSVGVSAFP